MIGTVLTYQDYDQIIDHCKKCKSGFGIEDFINKIIEEFSESNCNLELNLMERIEVTVSSLQGYSEFQEYDVLDFSNEFRQIRNASLEYMYSYLIAKFTGKNKTKILHAASFNNQQLIKILSALKQQRFLSFKDVSKILWVFNGEIKPKESEKICWMDKAKNGTTNHRTLLHFLDVLCGAIIFSERHTSLFIEIQSKFVKDKKDPFVIKNLKQNTTNYLSDKRSGKFSERQKTIKAIVESNRNNPSTVSI